MADLVLPFDVKAGSTDGVETPLESGLYRLLPEDMQAACQRNPQLIAYLRMLPIDETGVPEYYQEMSRALGGLKRRNLIYPVSDQIHIHVLSTGDERDHYIPIEPNIGIDVAAKAAQVEERMVELAYLFEGAETDGDRREVLHTILLKLCRIAGGSGVAPAGREDGEDEERSVRAARREGRFQAGEDRGHPAGVRRDRVRDRARQDRHGDA